MAEIEIISDYKPFPQQQLAHQAKQRFKLYGGAMGGGKSKWGCEEAKDLSMKYPGNRGIMCRYHLSDFKNSTLKTLLECLPPELVASHNRAENTIFLKNGSEIIYMGMSSEENVAKLKSMEIGWFFMDEASEVPYEHFLLFQSRLRRRLPNGTYPPFFGLMASNPEDCWLKDYFLESPKEDPKITKTYEFEIKGIKKQVEVIIGDERIFIPSLPRDNFYLPEDYEAQLRKTYPSDWVERYLEGSWADLTSGDKVIPYDWVNAAVNREMAIENRPIISCDVARFGDDEIVICCGQGNVMIEPPDITRKKDLMTTASRVEMFYRKHNARLAIVDDVAVGGGVTDRLRQLGLKVIAFNGGQKATEEKKYINRKSEAWFYARSLFEEGRVSVVNDPILKRQLSGVKYVVMNGKLKVEKKEDVKKRLTTSPDRADALIMMLWGAKSIKDPARDFARKLKQPLSLFGNRKKNKYGWDNT